MNFMEGLKSNFPLTAEPNHVFILGEEFERGNPSPCLLATKRINYDPKIPYIQVRSKGIENELFSQAQVVWEGFTNCPDPELNSTKCYVTNEYEQPIWGWGHNVARIPILYLHNFPPN